MSERDELHESFERLPAELRPVCAAAVEPAEIAAALEARGISSRVASLEFDEADVFALSRRLFRELPRVPTGPSTGRKRSRFGGYRELLRGLMFAAPSVMFAAAINASRIHVATWTFLLALTVGWAFSQGVAAIGSRYLSRGATIGWLSTGWIALATGATAGLAALGLWVRGGPVIGIGLASVVTLYVVSCSVVLLRSRPFAMAAPLIPASMVAIAYLLDRRPRLLADAVPWFCIVAVAMTVVFACLPDRRASSTGGSLRREDLTLGARFFLHGLACGLATTLVIELSSGGSSSVPLACYPILVTLGVMEWQLYSLKARAGRALDRAHSTRRFHGLVTRAYVGSLLTYLMFLAMACVGVGWYLATRHAGTPMEALVAEFILGCAFFASLVGASNGVSSMVLAADGAGLVAYLAVFITRIAEGRPFDHQSAALACLVAVSTAAVVSILGTQRSVRSPFSYQ